MGRQWRRTFQSSRVMICPAVARAGILALSPGGGIIGGGIPENAAFFVWPGAEAAG